MKDFFQNNTQKLIGSTLEEACDTRKCRNTPFEKHCCNIWVTTLCIVVLWTAKYHCSRPALSNLVANRHMWQQTIQMWQQKVFFLKWKILLNCCCCNIIALNVATRTFWLNSTVQCPLSRPIFACFFDSWQLY
jgi:hypothetical protein